MQRRILIAGWATLLLFPLSGWGLLWFFPDVPWHTMFRSHWHPLLQLPAGLALGFALGYLAKAVVSMPFMEGMSHRYARIVAALHLSPGMLLFLSFCAGFGEELFFRGALQPLAGVWLTAFIFVALHGYLNPWNWRISLYGIFMAAVIALLGYCTEWAGIWMACAAHMGIDIVLFFHLHRLGTRLRKAVQAHQQYQNHETTPPVYTGVPAGHELHGPTHSPEDRS